MPHISPFRFPKEDVNRLSGKIVEAALLIRNKKELTAFFDDLLTSTEKVMLGKRLLIAMFLEHDYTYQEIRRVLKVGETTIAAISEKLQQKGDGFHIAVKKLQRQEKIEAIFDAFERLMKSIPPKIGPGRWRFLRE